ncbi:MAG: AAA family ATPase [Thermogutta sp.]
MIRIRISAVEIRNCGPWRGAWRLEIPEAPLAVLCRPNEQGKSTLLAAIPAVFWGEGAPAKNWFAAEKEYEAAVEFERELRDPAGRILSKTAYRAVRRFEGDGVVLAELREGGWHTIYQGRHKARGGTVDNAKWREFVNEAWVAVSPQSFCHVAVLSQPAQWRVDAAGLQTLISGSGNTTAEEASERLLQRFRTVSKFSKRAGIASSDARKDGDLEQAEARRKSLQQSIDEAQRRLEGAQRRRDELEEVERQTADCVEDVRKLEAQKTLVEEVRTIRRRLATAERDLDRWKAANREAEQAARKLADLREQLAVQPSFLTQAELSTLKETRQAIEEVRTLAEKRVSEDQLRERLRQLEEDYAAVRNWPEDAAERIAELQRREQAANQADAAIAEAERAVARLSPVPDVHKRYRLTAAAAAAAFLLGLAVGGSAGGWGWGLATGIILGAAAAACAALIYHPMREHPGRANLAARLRELEDLRGQARDSLREVQDAVAGWAGSYEAAQLTQLLQTWSVYREKRRQWDEEIAGQLRLREALAIDRLPELAARLVRTWAVTVGEASPAAELDAAMLARARKALDGAIDLRQKIQVAEEAFQNLLQSHAVRTVEELAERLREAQREHDAALLQLDQLKMRSAFAEELARGTGADLDAAATEAAKRLADVQRRAETLRIRRNNLELELARLEGDEVVNVAQREWKLRETEAEIARLERRRDAISAAWRLLRDAQTEFSSQHREAMQRSLNESMRSWTGQQYAEFELDQDFRLAVRIPAAGAQANSKLIETLSQGARDQLALALRTAFLDRLAGEIVLPLLLDDPFVTWDHQRREQFRRGLDKNGSGRQIILLTHDPAFTAWGAEITVRPI